MSANKAELPSKPKCISIGPFGDDLPSQKNRQNLELVIERALGESFDYKAFWKIPRQVMTSDIFNALISSNLVIVDLKGFNPNAMYELGIVHAFNRPTLHLIDDQSEVPWDIDKNFLLKYSCPIEACDVDKLVIDIKDRLNSIARIAEDKDPVYNTFYRDVRQQQTMEALIATHSGDSVLVELVEQVRNLSSRLGGLESDVRELVPKKQSNWDLLQTDSYKSAYASLLPRDPYRTARLSDLGRMGASTLLTEE